MSKDFELSYSNEKIKRLMRRKQKRFLEKVERNFRGASQEFIFDIVNIFYTGRRGGVGLNVISGNLRDSWSHVVSSYPGNVIANIRSRATYGIYHEVQYKPKSHPRKMPPRTDVQGYFTHRDIGKRMFRQAIKKAIKDT